jgi:hypothetical protein
MSQPKTEELVVERCVDDHVAFQEHEIRGDQGQARDAARRCSSTSCPRALRRECLAASDRLHEALASANESARLPEPESAPEPEGVITANAASAAAPSTTPSSSRGGPRETSVGPIAGIAGLSIATAGLVTFGVAGAIALHRRNELNAACKASRCAPEHAEYLTSARTAGHTATAGAVVASVGAALGIVGLIVGLDTPADAPQTAMVLSPRLVGLRGEF